MSDIEFARSLKVIDTDTHYTEPHDLWVSRVSAKFKDQVPHVKRNPETGRDAWYVKGDQFLRHGGASSVFKKSGEKIPFYERDLDSATALQLDEAHPAAYDVKARLKFMDEVGTYAQIVYPNLVGFGMQVILKLKEPELRLLIASVYNDAMAQMQRESGNRLFPQALLPFWDIQAAVKEAQRAKKLGLTGVLMCPDPDMAGLPDVPDPYWDPLWDVCGQLDMPINFHVGASDQSLKLFTDGGWKSQDKYRSHVLGALNLEMGGNGRVLSNLICSDVPDRFPKTKWVSVESGIGWIPYMLERLEYQLGEVMPKNMKHRAGPTEVFKRQCYACFWFETTGPNLLMEKLGADNVLYETDYPHSGCLYPGALEHAVEVLSPWGRDIMRKVLQDNAVKLYNLPIDTTSKKDEKAVTA